MNNNAIGRVVTIQDFPGEVELDKIAAELLSAPAGQRRVKWIREPEKRGRTAQTIGIVAHRHLIAAILGDAETFALTHYDNSLPHTRFFLTSDTDEYALRQSILREAMGHDAHRLRHDDLDMATIAERVVADVIGALRAGQASQHPFDLVRAYSFLVGYYICVDAFGVRGPDRSPVVAHVMRLAKRAATKRGYRLDRDTRPMQNLVDCCQAMIGHLFANFENRNAILNLLGKQGAKQVRKQIRKARAIPGVDQRGTLVARLELARQGVLENRPAGMSPHAWSQALDRNIDGILFEFVGTLIVLVGAAFPRMLKVARAHDLDFADIADLLRPPDPEFKVVNELLRLDSPTRTLTRRVTRTLTLNGEPFEEGDYVKLLIPSACRDAAAFTCPEAFDPSRPDQAAALHFGPWGPPHGCRAPNWTSEILRQLFLQIGDLPNIRLAPGDDGKPREFQGGIDSWLATFD